MSEQRLDDLVTKGDIDLSKLVTTNSNSLTYSFLERNNLSIEFENRDALLEALCERVFGAKPTFTNDTTV